MPKPDPATVPDKLSPRERVLARVRTVLSATIVATATPACKNNEAHTQQPPTAHQDSGVPTVPMDVPSLVVASPDVVRAPDTPTDTSLDASSERSVLLDASGNSPDAPPPPRRPRRPPHRVQYHLDEAVPSPRILPQPNCTVVKK